MSKYNEKSIIFAKKHFVKTYFANYRDDIAIMRVANRFRPELLKTRPKLPWESTDEECNFSTYTAPQKHESTLLHTCVLNKFLTADRLCTTKYF